MLFQSVCTKCILQIAHPQATDYRLIFLHSWWESNETFWAVASVISSQLQVSIFFCVSMEVVLSWKLLFSTRAWFVSIFYSATIICFVFPIANRTLLLQESTGHLGAQPVKTHVYLNCFFSSIFFWSVRHFEFWGEVPLYTSSQTPVRGSTFPVLVRGSWRGKMGAGICLF